MVDKDKLLFVSTLTVGGDQKMRSVAKKMYGLIDVYVISSAFILLAFNLSRTYGTHSTLF